MKRMLTVGLVVTVISVTMAAGEPWGRNRVPEFTKIESRIFDAARYDAAQRTLTIVFASGAAYAYSGVPREVYLDFTRIVNKGEYFHRHIRNAYPCQRVDRYPAAWAARD